MTDRLLIEALRAMYLAAIDRVPAGQQYTAQCAAEAIGMGIIHSDPPRTTPKEPTT